LANEQAPNPRFRLGLYCHATPDGGEVALDLPDDFVASDLLEWSGTFVVLLEDKDCVAAGDLGKALRLRLDRLLPALHIHCNAA